LRGTKKAGVGRKGRRESRGREGGSGKEER